MNLHVPSARSILVLSLLPCLVACELRHGGPRGDQSSSDVPGSPLPPGAGETPPAQVPPRIDTHDLCVHSADCPAGQHCDLGECVQACNTDSGCPGDEICSPRARCLPPLVPDAEPAPVTARIGVVRAAPVTAVLTDRDDELRVELTSDSPDPVRFRVQVNAPHLSLKQPRGEFVGGAVLDFAVDASQVDGTDGPGTIKIFTNLGEIVIEAPIRVGLTAGYQGSMTYDGGAIPLGTVGIALGMREENGDVVVEVDGERSLLFPEGNNGAVRGRGFFTHSEGVDVTLRAAWPSEFAGERNHFRRALGREVRFQLTPGASGSLDGRFTETLHGVLPTPLTLSGRVHLERGSSGSGVESLAVDAAVMPTATLGALDVQEAFPSWTEEDCLSMRDSPDLLAQAYLVDRAAYGPLDALLEGRLSGTSAPVDDIAASCESELLLGPGVPATEYACASPARLACAVRDVAASALRGPDASAAFSGLLTHLVTPGLLVAQSHVVAGARTSFLEGLSSERTRLVAARQALVPAAIWSLSADVLSYLLRIPLSGVPAADASGEAPHARAFRTVARLVHLLSTVDGETSRIDAADRSVARGDHVREAQERGVLTLFEVAALASVLEAWHGHVPTDVGAEFLDVLAPMDRGFSTLLQGALVFGVPEGFVPFLHRAGSSASNFEQVLASVEPRLAQFEADESSFVVSNRAYEQGAERLEQELLSVHGGIEAQLANLCGPTFDLEAEGTDGDWARCGAEHGGEVGALVLDIQQASERLRSAYGRILGLREKIIIERRRIDAVNAVRQATISFIGSTGERLEELVVVEGAINAAQKCLEISANANAWNLGAPVGMAMAASMIEGQRTVVNIERQRLQTAQEMRVHADGADVEVLNGLAGIKTMMVDMAQLDLEMQQEALGVVQAEVDVRNALSRARRLSAERTRTLSAIQGGTATDPTFRILKDRAALQTLHSRGEAQRGLYLAGRALEYDLNQPLGAALGAAVFNAFSAAEVARLKTCLLTIAADAELQSSGPEAYSTEVSLRHVLGIRGPRQDEVTGVTMGEGEQFRQALLQNEHLDAAGAVSIEFSSNLEPGNGLWPVNVCDDKIVSVEAQLVGSFQGDDEAQVELALDGGGVLARCDRSELVNWSTSGRAVIQAGVNTFGSLQAPNASLRGLSVASGRWRLTIPSAETAPANADLDLHGLEDVVLRIRHQARPGAPTSSGAQACLANVGAGR